MASTTCEISLLFNGDSKPITLRDTNLIRMIPMIVRVVEGMHPNWETENVVYPTAIHIPYPKWAGDFIFEHIREYRSPEENDEWPDIQNYPEAARKSLEELKQIIGLATFLECDPFMSAIGFVIADKLNSMPMEQIAAFLGFEMDPEAGFFSREDGWERVSP